MSRSGNRLALLIGVRHYPSLGSLNTPYQDVRLLRRTLLGCGFADEDITVLPSDPDARICASDIRRALADFARRLEEVGQANAADSCAVVYFAGHGVTHGRDSLLLSDYASLDPGDLAAEGVPLSELVRCVGRLEFPVMVLVDTCQSLLVSRGIQSEPVTLPNLLIGNMLVDLATCPGEIAFDGQHHSPYAEALSEEMPVAGRSISDLFVAVRRKVRSRSHDRQSPQSISSISSSHPFIIDYQAAVIAPSRVPEGSSTLGATRAGALGPRRNYSAEEIRTKGHLVHKLRAKDGSGSWAYYFVLVEPQFEAGFNAAIAGDGMVDLEHYGVVLASNYGMEPTPEVRRHLEDTYGFKLDESRALTLLEERKPLPGTTAPPLQSNDTRPMLAALRQSLGMGSWRWLVMWVAAENCMRFALAAAELAAIDQGGVGVDGKGILGGLRKAIDTLGGSHFDIERLTPFGTVLFRGKGEHIPPTIQHQILQQFGVVFDWTDWERMNGTTVTLP